MSEDFDSFYGWGVVRAVGDEVVQARAALGVLGWMPPALVVAQHTVRLSLEETYGRLRRIRVLRQGDNAISFYEPAV